MLSLAHLSWEAPYERTRNTLQRARRDVANADVARPGTAKTATWRRARYRRIRAFRLTAFDPWDDEVHLEVRIDVVVELEHDEWIHCARRRQAASGRRRRTPYACTLRGSTR
jgi:hypothetical protein